MSDITVTIFEETEERPLDMRLRPLIEFLQNKLAAVPEEHRDAATFGIYVGGDDYDGCWADAYINYTRPMTAEEEEARATEEKRAAEEAAFNAQWVENMRNAGYSSWEIRSGNMNDYYRPDHYPPKGDA